ncbi:cell cycle checkpoint protein RAD1 isoform X1 [Dendroctonus ponderosae]|uniref:cell cycle checkpoint protein RAD1 isoform X1 n=2 Tax=Dendroctonus ponderosae TaxID=77166 RepID=UPI002035ADDE|nr:cell cycle checkpoint protein RAD1 isoform X1 [Dendroctonus ponderosae]
MLFSAELTDVKVVYNVLKSISIKEFAIFRPVEEGLKVTLDEMRCMETSAYIPREMFTMYHVTESDNNIFKVNLKTLTDILNIFGDDSHPNLKLTFKSVGSPLRLVMNHSEENITVDCEIKTMNTDEFQNPSLSEECNLNKIVVLANVFVELLQRLDNSSDDLKVTFSPEFPYFTLKSTSLSGSSEVSLNKHSDSVTIYQCKEKTDFTYAFSNIRHIIKVMHYANKVSVSTGGSGLLGFQLVITSDDKQMYVEYYVTPLFMGDD